MEGNCLSYDCRPRQIDLTGEPQYPCRIQIDCHYVEKITPSQKILYIVPRAALERTIAEFEDTDMISMQTFYDALHRVLPGLPQNNHLFIFIDTHEWNGFLSDDLHIRYLAIHQSNIIIAILNETFFARGIKLRNEPIVPQTLLQVLHSNLPQQSQVQRVTANALALTQSNRSRIINDASDRGIVDVTSSIPGVVTIQPNDPYIVAIPVCPKFKNLLIALNATLVAIDLHLAPRGRTTEVDEDLVKDIVCAIFEEHVPHEEEEENDNEEEENQNEEEDERNETVASHSFEWP